MSSEMRAFIEQMDILVDDFYKYQEGDARVPFVVIRDAVVAAISTYQDCRTLLARTEAGADGGPLKVFSEGPWVYLPTGQHFSGDDLDGAAFAEYRTRPQDASGDAELVRALRNQYVSERTFRFQWENGMDYENARANAESAVNQFETAFIAARERHAAMQAKEAK